MMPADGVVGVVLAGGASTRMGRDKALIEIDGQSLAEGAAERLAAACSEVLVADGGRGLIPGLLSIPDREGAGPAAGLLAAAERRPGRALLALACDLPRVPTALLAKLAEHADGDALVPRWQRGVEPLCACYRPAALTVLAERVGKGRLALHRWLENVDVRYLRDDELSAFGPPEELFLNLNRPRDLERLVSLEPSR